MKVFASLDLSLKTARCAGILPILPAQVSAVSKCFDPAAFRMLSCSYAVLLNLVII